MGEFLLILAPVYFIFYACAAAALWQESRKSFTFALGVAWAVWLCVGACSAVSLLVAWSWRWDLQ
jgi:hypothetical protein